jgi:AcrR family transcriptional regulator
MPRATVRARETPSKATRRRDDVIERLIDVFLVEGFADLSIDDMAARLHCSKTTIYTVASSKEQIKVDVVRAFFKRATERVEVTLRVEDRDSIERVRRYLSEISAQLAPASPAFFADLDESPATREIYQHNTAVAARRVQEMVLAAVPQTSRSQAVFIGAVAAQIMEAIHRGEIEATTGFDDSVAYQALAELVMAAVARSVSPAAAS